MNRPAVGDLFDLFDFHRARSPNFVLDEAADAPRSSRPARAESNNGESGLHTCPFRHRSQIWTGPRHPRVSDTAAIASLRT